MTAKKRMCTAVHQENEILTLTLLLLLPLLLSLPPSPLLLPLLLYTTVIISPTFIYHSHHFPYCLYHCHHFPHCYIPLLSFPYCYIPLPLLPPLSSLPPLLHTTVIITNTDIYHCHHFLYSYIPLSSLPPLLHTTVIIHHHHHQSLNREGRWGTTNDFATSFLHFSLFSTALWDLPNSRPVHCLMLSSHLFLCRPCLLPPFHCALQDGFDQT